MMFIKYLALFICLLGVVFSQDLPFSVAIFDQHPSKNGNFQPPDGSVTPGLVKPNLNPLTKIPEMVSLDPNNQINKNGRMLYPSLFKYFFAPDVSNLFLNKTLTLKKDSSSGFYEYFNDYFFPIDGQGWDGAPYNLPVYDGHNFHFCVKMNTYFKFKLTNPPMQFNFRGDDDVYVFINNKLALDLGGLHSYEDGVITFDSTTSRNLGLTDGGIYSFDFYYCERKTSGSHMRFQINFPLDCTTKDYCGVCNGGGDCCNAAINCNTPPGGSKCYTAACPAWNTPGVTMENMASKCTYTPITYSNLDNQCWDYSCDSKTGAPVAVSKPCAVKPCATSKCSNSTGCSYTSTCNPTNACSVATCGSDGMTCNQTPKDCSGTDKCLTYSCDPVRGCTSSLNYDPIVKVNGTVNNCQVRKCNSATGATFIETIPNCDKCTGTPNKCEVIGQCDPTTGKYTFLRKPEISDGNPCTLDHCDNSTGIISHTDIVCSGCTYCDPDLNEYKCQTLPKFCDDKNPCTTDTCQSSGNCTNTFCPEPANKCLTAICTETGCDTEPTVCPESENPCEEPVCDPNGGCGFKTRDCTVGISNCTDAFCDARLGCVTVARQCVADRPNCQFGVCNNETNECEYHDYDPYPFACQTAAVVSVGVVAGVVVAGAVALAAAVFGGKKGYDYWKEHKGQKMSMSNANPLYETKPGTGENPLYSANE